MTSPSPYDIVKKAVVAACDDIECLGCLGCGTIADKKCPECNGKGFYREPNLKDILRALKDCKKKVQYARLLYEDFVFLHTNDDDAVKWQLGKPLSEQSEETVLFLSQLLSHG